MSRCGQQDPYRAPTAQKEKLPTVANGQDVTRLSSVTKGGFNSLLKRYGLWSHFCFVWYLLIHDRARREPGLNVRLKPHHGHSTQILRLVATKASVCSYRKAGRGLVVRLAVIVLRYFRCDGQICKSRLQMQPVERVNSEDWVRRNVKIL